MVGHHQQRRLRLAPSHLADRPIHRLIKRQQLVVVPAPKHMGILIHRGKVEEQKPVAVPAQGMVQQHLFGVEYQPALREKLRQIEYALTERGGVLANALRIESPGLARIRRRLRDGQRGLFRIDIHG